MATRLGTGPVFEYEWLVGTRRWQLFASRALFVAILLTGLTVVWRSDASLRTATSIRGMATVGQKFSQAIVGIELSLILLAAPAATAGAICLDKARGNLAHLFTTDLSDAEIVLGKLAARLVPVLALVACTAPVMMIATLLGGADPDALFGAFLVSLGLAFVGCSLAMTLSVWGTKTHEVLLAAYLIIVAWLLAQPAWSTARWSLGSGIAPPEWLAHLNPFLLCFANVGRPGSVGLMNYLLFCGLSLALSAALATLAVWRVRVVGVRHLGGVRAIRREWRLDGLKRLALKTTSGRLTHRLWLALPRPTLDGNPVLWREWHRNRPTRWTRLCWFVYVAVCGAFSVLSIVQAFQSGGKGNNAAGMAAWTNGMQACVGLLLLSVGSATALSEERVRGSLDVVLATPLSTPSILWGKWWGTYRRVPLLCLLPCAVLTAFSFYSGNWMGTVLLAINILTMGAMITSLGLGVATWVPRLGRAVAIVVSAYVVLTVGWLFLVMAVADHNIGEQWMMASPFFGPGNITYTAAEQPGRVVGVFSAGFAWSIFFLFAAAILYLVTLATFNRSLGRMDESQPRPGYLPPRPKRWIVEPELVVE